MPPGLAILLCLTACAMGRTGRRVGAGTEAQGVGEWPRSLVFAGACRYLGIWSAPKGVALTLGDAKESAANLALTLLGDWALALPSGCVCCVGLAVCCTWWLGLRLRGVLCGF